MRNQEQISPPRWADRFLQFYCSEQYLEEIQGDVHELFEVRQRSFSLRRAKALFIWDVIRFFRWSNMKHTNRSNNTITMVRNNFKIASRSLTKHKFYTGINLLGISLGIACFILTYLYVEEELSFDKFHSNLDQIHRVWIHEFDEGDEYFEGVVPVVMAGPLRSDFPEIEETVQIWRGRVSYTSREQLTVSGLMSVVSPNFLKVFDFQLIEGDPETALSKRENIVLTEADAMKRFGRTDIIGEVAEYIIRGEKVSFVVSGVIENPPSNSSIEYKTLISDANNDRIINENIRTSWFSYSTEIYVQLKAGATAEGLESKFPKMVETALGEDYEEGLAYVKLQPMADVHFDRIVDGDTIVGNIQTVRILGVVGFVILLLAGINFINLSVGQSMKRAREVGVRKVLGAYKRQLILQFISESVLLTLLAAIIGLGVSVLLLPMFNEFADKQMQLQFSGPLFRALGISVLTIGFLSGIYPAFVLSSFKPVVALKSRISTGKRKSGLAYSLIVVQFLAAIFFVSTTIIMKNQLNYLTSKELGFDREAKVYMRLPRAKGDLQGMIRIMIGNGAQSDQVMEEMKQLPGIKEMTHSNNYFGDNGWVKFGYREKGKEKVFHYNHIAENFTDLYGIEIVEGEGFMGSSEYVQNTGILVNEAYVKAFGPEEPIGGKITGERFGEHHIIGVVKDFHYASLHEPIKPLVMSMNPMPVYKGIQSIETSQLTRSTITATIRLESLEDLKPKMKAIWEERFTVPFNLVFLDERLEKMYEEEQRTDAMVTMITVLAIIIASLGLLGLAALTIKNKFKEIGIRKVLGASSINIFQLLYKIFVSPIVVAFVISIPLTVYVMSDWLSNFAYQVDISAIHFVLAGIAILIITLLAVSYQSLKVALSNPVDTIRYE